MHYLLIGLAVTVVVLLVLYLVARKVKPFGQALAFVCTVLSRVNVKIAEYMNKAAAYYNSACTASLRGITDTGHWTGIEVLKRIKYFVLGLLILLGETVNTLLVLPSLFNTTSHVQLPGVVEFASAALFICCPALFGDIVLECWGKIRGAGLFHNMGKPSRWILGVVSALLLVFTILVNGYFYVYRSVYLADPQSAQGMVPYILGGLGIEVGAVSPFALLALQVGSAGVVTLFLWGVEHVCRIIAGAASLLPHVLDVLAVHLSQGTMSVHGEYIGHDPYQVPAPSFSTSRPVSPGQTVAAILPQQASPVGDADGEHVVPIETTITEVPMSNPEKNATFAFFGSPGSRMFPPVAQKIATLRATDCILSSLYLDLSITHVQTALPGIVDLSPPHATRHAALLHSETEQHAYHTLLCSLADQLVETHLETKASPAPLIFVIDCHILADAVDMLEAIKHRLPLHSLVVVTELSGLDVQNATVQAGIVEMQRLYAEDILETTIVCDPHFLFASRYGEETQHQFLAQTLVGFVLAHKHNSQNNRSFTDVLHKLHTLSPFTAVSFASEQVATGSMPKRWAWVPGVKNQAGTGNYSDILAQTRVAIERVVTDESTRTFPASVSADAPVAILTSVPIALNDPRHAECVQDNARYVRQHYTNATSLTVRGNGCAYPHHIGGRFLVQASCLYPLAPASLLRLQEGKKVHVTPLYPVTALEGVSGNGNVPVQEQKRNTKAPKAATPTRQTKPTASSRRVGRKNTKMAK